MNEKEVKKTIDGIECFKNTTVNFNEEKQICDVYTRCLLSEKDFVKKVEKLKGIEYVKCDFGIFEIMFPLENLEKSINKFVKTFSE